MDDAFTTLKKRTKQLLDENGMTQTQLAEDVFKKENHQSNVSKRLNLKTSDRLTMDEVLDISEWFHVSLDWLFGKTEERNSNNGSKYENKFIINYLYGLIKSGKVQVTPTMVNEKIVYTFVGVDETGDEHWMPNINKDIEYNALYFPKYWDPSDSKNCIEGQNTDGLISFACDCGNIEKGPGMINDFLDTYVHFLPEVKAGRITEEQFEGLLAKFLK